MRLSKKICSIILSVAMVFTITGFQTKAAYAVTGQEIANYAIELANGPVIPEVSGGTSLEGFDCSGFTWYLYNHFGVNIKERGAEGQRLYVGTPVDYSTLKSNGDVSNLQPGDLIFYDTSIPTDGSSDHVGVYVGNGNMVDTSYSQSDLVERPLSGFAGVGSQKWYQVICGVKRVLSPDTPQTSYKISINANGGTSATTALTVKYGNKCDLSPDFVTRPGYELKGWNLYRPADKKWFSSDKGWQTMAQINANGYEKLLYNPSLSITLDSSWLENLNTEVKGFTFYAVWEKKKVDLSECLLSLQYNSTSYTGKVREPKVVLTEPITGDTLVEGVDYWVTYKNNKNVGTASAVISGKGFIVGERIEKFKIRPKVTSITSLKKATRSFTVKWKKQSTQISGYQVNYSTSRKFSKSKTRTISSYKTTALTMKKLYKNKKYYVRVRTYKTVNKVKYYSGWSTAKTVVTK